MSTHRLAYYGSGGSGYGVFTWSLFFNWGSIPKRVKDAMKSPVDPYPSPTMAGGLLAANREYFFEIGGYDDDMEGTLLLTSMKIYSQINRIKHSIFYLVWGGENLELSFRVRFP